MPDNSFTYEPATAKSGSIIIDIVQTIVIALAISVVMYLFVVIPSQVDGPSMNDNFQDGQLLLTNKIIQIVGGTSFTGSIHYDYQRGDVIVFQKPNQENPYIKRVIAVPGNKLKFENNSYYIDGKRVVEEYIPDTPEFRTELPLNGAFLTEGVEVTVPEGKYFVSGDNRRNSLDSRFEQIGFVDRDDMKGKVFLRFWPITEFGLIGTGKFEDV